MLARFPRKKTLFAIATGALVVLVIFGVLCLVVPGLRHPKVVFMFLFCFVAASIIICCSVKSGRPRSRETSSTKEEEASQATSGPPRYGDVVIQISPDRITPPIQQNEDLLRLTAKPDETEPPIPTPKL
ncbi:uncharacterized protein [Palaemon carinicauda]|uniref:uncharacterized protein isoform X2 n=1 Tax=Palaemon carinicauda TaxID=392227 RepID=UPI0035B5AA25